MLGLLMFAAVNLCACSDDDDNSGNSDLVGTWEVVTDKGWEKVNGEIKDSWDQEGNEIGDKWRLDFKENGRFYMYDVVGSDVTDSDEVSWAYKNGKIYLYSAINGIESEFWAVKELSSSNLALESYYKYEEDGDVYEEWAYSTYKKVE